jgi:hypothetical protein
VNAAEREATKEANAILATGRPVAPGDLVTVYDVATDRVRAVPRSEAVAGVARYARSLGPGTAACGEWERQAAELATGDAVR